jgi:glyoxylase-like metal-dependent hydrolase (beta-lactamase superfamily II)
VRGNIRTTSLVIAAAAALAAPAPAPVQTPRSQPATAATAAGPDVKAALAAAANALGMIRGPQRIDALSTVEYWGTGFTYAVGQSFRPDLPWPAFKATYHASISYLVPGMRIDITRTNPDGPVQGGGGLPLAAPQRQIQVVGGRFAWNESEPGAGLVPGAGTATPAAAAVNDRLLQLWTTPYGVVKAAMEAGASTKVSVERGATIITFPAAGATVKATLNAKNLVERVEVRSDNPVLGDIVTETAYTDYKDLTEARSDVLFPAHIASRQGGFPVLDLTITKTDTNNPYVIFPTPDNVEKAGADQSPPPVKVDTQKVAEGVWYLTGGTHHSVAVEFKDHVVLVECPQNDARALGVVDAIKKTVPNKPIKYVVNTHHHFDHSGGLRACVAEGATIITQAANKPYYEKLWAMLHTVSPDRLARSPRKAAIEAVASKRVLADGARTLELYRLEGSDHADTMLIAYLPKEKILVEADVYTPAAPDAPAGPVAKENVNLYDNILRLKLDVQRIAPLHGRLVSIADLRAAIGRP